MRAFRIMTFVILLWAFLGCERAGLYELAQGGFIYVLTKDPMGNVRLSVTTGGDYFEEYFVINTPMLAETLFVSPGGMVFIGLTGNMHVNKSDYDAWKSVVLPCAPLNTRYAADRENVYAMDNSSGNVYRFDFENGSWILLPLLPAPVLPLNVVTKDDGSILFGVQPAGGVELFDTNTNIFVGTIMPTYNPGPLINVIFAMKRGPAFFLGDVDGLYATFSFSGIAGEPFNRIGPSYATLGPPQMALAYAVVNDDLIVVVTEETAPPNTVHLHRLQHGTLVDTGISFNDAAKAAAFSLGHDEVALWIDNPMADAGIYVYNVKDGRLKKISRIPGTDVRGMWAL